VFDKLVPDGKLDVAAVRNEPWETQFKPLSFEDAVRVWTKLHPTDYLSAKKDTHTALLWLSDRSYIMIDGITKSAPRDIYPFFLAQLAKRKQRDHEFFEKIVLRSKALFATKKATYKFPFLDLTDKN
jgi:hypothetical protein